MNDDLNPRGTSNTGATLIGFALGAVVGAGVALLLAPESGKKTRARLASTAQRWGKSAGESLEQARDTVTDLGIDAKSALRAGQEAFRSDFASRETRTERRLPHAGDAVTGLKAPNGVGEESAR